MSKYVNLTDEAMVETLARDNEALSKENIRLNQIVDAFCALAGRLPQFQASRLTEWIVSDHDPKAMRETINIINKARTHEA